MEWNKKLLNLKLQIKDLIIILLLNLVMKYVLLVNKINFLNL